MGCHRDAIARPRIQFDDLLLLQLVFGPNDRPRVVGCVFQVIDDHTLDFRAKGRHQVRHQIVGKGPFLGDIAHEHGNRAADCLIDIDDENLVVVPNENRAPAAGWQYRAHLHLNHRFVHSPRERYPHGQEKQAA